MSMENLSNCIFDKEKVKAKIKKIIDGLKEDASANTVLQKQINTFNIENERHTGENESLNPANENLKIANQLVASNGDSTIQAEELNAQNKELITKNKELKETSLNQANEIEKLKNELETQKKTSEYNMSKIISTLAGGWNQELQRLQEKADAGTRAATAAIGAEVVQKGATNAADTLAKVEEAQAKVEEAEKKATEAQAALEEAQRKMDKTESMRNIEIIQQELDVNIQEIQSKLWETSKQYMRQQYGTHGFKDNIASDPFVQAELKTLLNDTTELKNADAIQEAHKNVITRHYKTLYPNASDASDNDVMNMELPLDVKDHIVIPPYLYLSLTDFYFVFSVFGEDNKKNTKMRFLDSSGNNNKDHKELSLEKGFHIIIKKLGNGTEDFFSRIDVKFVLLNTAQNASTIISEVFKESTFYGHIPTQTILSIDQSNSTSTSTSSRGGNKTLKNNKKKLKKKKKYTQNRHIMKKLKH